MTIVERTTGKLVLRDGPWLVWLVGGLFVVAGSAVALASDERVFGAAFAVTGAGIIIAFANTVTATFDRSVGRFTRSIKGLVRNSETAYPLTEIVAVSVYAGRTARPSRTYRLELTLSSGGQVPLTPSFSSGKRDKEQTAAAIRQFLELQEEPDVPIPGFGEMFRMMFDPNAASHLKEMYGGAVSDYEAIVRRDPDNVDARRQLALALAMQNRPLEARQQLEAARGLAISGGNQGVRAEIEEMIARLKTKD